FTRSLIIEQLLENLFATERLQCAQQERDGSASAGVRSALPQAFQEQLRVQAAGVVYRATVQVGQPLRRLVVGGERLKSEGAAEMREVGAGQKQGIGARQSRQRLGRRVLLRGRHRSDVQRHDASRGRRVSDQRQLHFDRVIADQPFIYYAKLRMGSQKRDGFGIHARLTEGRGERLDIRYCDSCRSAAMRKP